MDPYYDDGRVTLYEGSAVTVAAGLPSESVGCIVTSPPYYGLRDYDHIDQIGSEATVADYVSALVATFRAFRRVLSHDGTLWLNLGDSYASKPVGSFNGGGGAFAGRNMSGVAASGGIDKSQAAGVPPKNLIGVPWRVALALQEDGWILRSDVIWAKPSCMPESVTDRPTRSHEYLFLLVKSPRYFYDADAISEPAEGSQSLSALSFDRSTKEAVVPGQSTAQHRVGRGGPTSDTTRRNKRTVWTVPTVPFSGAHFAVYPPELIRPCIRAGARPGSTVLDPFSGSGTTGMVALEEGHRYVGIDTNREYLDLSLRERFTVQPLDFGGAA